MDEFDLYKIKSWNQFESHETRRWMPKSTNVFIDLSKNPHPMAINILYANFNRLDSTFATWFRVTGDTIFLYEKLKFKFVLLYNHRLNITYYELTTMKENITPLIPSYKRSAWEFRHDISYICANFPLAKIDVSFENLNWFSLSDNKHKCVMDFLKLHLSEVHWINLARNSSDVAVDFLFEARENGIEIEWWYASVNTNERIIKCFSEVKNQLSISALCKNETSSVVRFVLDEMYEKICWERFCENANDLAVDHIIDIYEKDNKDRRIVWECLCLNKNVRVFPILEKNREKIDWNEFYQNPICFQYDYEKMKERFSPLKNEICDIFLRPDNVIAKIENERMEGESVFDTISRLEF